MENYTQINFLDIEENLKYVKLLEKVARQAFEVEKLENMHLYLNVILTNPENIKKINKEYRKIDKETDVLSFPMFEKQEIEEMLKKGNKIEEVLGDIVISIPRVKQQAEEYGHSFERELAYMLIHGFYHLMGYDHMVEEEKIEMRKKEETVLDKLNITR